MMLLTPSEVGYFQQLASGAVITIELAVSSYLLALASGTVVGLVTLSHNWLIQAVWRVYASVIMGVPSLLVIFLFYYSGSAVLEGVIDITPFAAGLAALVVVYTVYIAELVRGAVRNVPRGQFEASAALAIRPLAAWRHVILPQAIRLALAGLITIWMVMLKDTALVSLAGLNDLVAHAKTAAGATKEPFIYFIIASLFFVIFSALTLRASAWLERRFGRGLAVAKV
jgi:His/Glu/Gln/Arg/opine family amino acid ABC transporter permease subunit